VLLGRGLVLPQAGATALFADALGSRGTDGTMLQCGTQQHCTSLRQDKGVAAAVDPQDGGCTIRPGAVGCNNDQELFAATTQPDGCGLSCR
jgi:hypothetical protein